MKEINLNTNDYKFINNFCKKYNIVYGKGIQNMLCVFLNEYKQNGKQ